MDHPENLERQSTMQKGAVLFTGGSGLLGGEFKKIFPEALYPTSKEFDITRYDTMERYVEGKNIVQILHAAAFTSPPKVEQDPAKAVEVNIIGTANVVKLCMEHNIRLIYISTDYVFKGDKGNYCETDEVHPVNKYAWSKLGGECCVRLYDNSLIIRTTFGPNEFPYEKAFSDQWTSRESVSVTAKLILDMLDKPEERGVVHVGGDRKTVLEYARRLSPGKNIQPMSTREMKFPVPKDTSLDVSKYNALIKRNTTGGHQ